MTYIEFIRTCLERKTYAIKEVKNNHKGQDTIEYRRFASLLDTLANLPPMEFSIAERLAEIADEYRGDHCILESGHWSGDVRAHFEMSSSFGHKGRMLTTIIRFMRCSRCLELGTAYGMSALFMLEALIQREDTPLLTTVEGLEQLYRISSPLLKNRYQNKVQCEFGWTSEMLPRLANTLGPVDFMFHDAGHSRKDYVNDFQAALPILAPGAVVLFDDIYWDDPRFSSKPQCYKGWREIVRHERVVWAVEIDDGAGLGLALLM